VLDEPSSGLDFHHMEQTASLLESLGGKHTLFIVTHDRELNRPLLQLCAPYGGRTNKEQYALGEEGGTRLHHYFNARSEL